MHTYWYNTSIKISTTRTDNNMYHIIDKDTQLTIAKRKTASAARRLRDRKDNEYGCYQHIVKFIAE